MFVSGSINKYAMQFFIYLFTMTKSAIYKVEHNFVAYIQKEHEHTKNTSRMFILEVFTKKKK